MQRERERVDLISFKSKLKLVLKDKATEYWDLLRKFTRAQLTKRELDAYARNILVTDENIVLHNLFIKSIVNNAFCPNSGPPIVLPSTPQVVNVKSWADANSKKKKEKKEKQKRGRDVDPKLKPEDTKRTKYDKSPSAISTGNTFVTLLLSSTQLTPLRNKMHRIANENGLKHVSNESVALMMAALEEYLKRIISHARDLPQTSTIPNQSPSTPKPISMEDLYQAVTGRPYLLGEDLSLNMERISYQLQ